MSDAATALERYEQSMRRHRVVYFAVVAGIVAALAVVFAVVIARGEAAHATLHTVAEQPATLKLTTASATQTQAWKTTDRVAQGTQPWNGTVITYSAHTIGGRDARTGARTWSYTRTDRTVCSVGQVDGVTIAVYLRDRSCDEVSAFDSGTGLREWTRTLDQDGAPVDGRATIQYAAGTMLVSTSAVVYAISPGPGTDGGTEGGINRWVYDRTGCVINRAVLGVGGVLISQTCGNDVDCAKVSFCGKGPQLLLRDLNAGRDDPDKKNFDHIIWNVIGKRATPVSADSDVTAIPTDGNTLQVFAPKTGQVTSSIALDPVPTDPSAAVAVATQSAQLIWIDGQLIRLNSDGSQVWRAASDAPPTVVDQVGGDSPYLDSARLTAVVGGTVTGLNVGTGKPDTRYSGVPAPADSIPRPMGSGFLVSGPSGTVVTR